MSHEITDRHMKKPEAGDVFESNDYQTLVIVKSKTSGKLVIEETFIQRGEKKVLNKLEFSSIKTFCQHYSFEHAPGYTIHYLDKDKED